jgi:ribosomal protein S18 acetylase RimI-like enzyme
MLPPNVKIIAKGEREKALDVFTMAFVNDPAMRWLMADASVYLKNVGAAQMALGGRSLQHETGLMLDDNSAAAFWLPPGIGVDEEAMGAWVEQVPRDEIKGDVMGLAEQMGGYHPEGPHWYLAALGVDIRMQGKGLGSILMKHALARVDQEHLPAYLESSNPRNISFYERHGFEVIGRIQSGSSPVITPMLRAARR